MADVETIPPILYKYYPAERLDVLENWTLRFSRPSQFNDTFDSVHRGTSTKLVDRLKYRNGLGILCLTEDADDQLMWVHYAAQHTGYVIGFDMTSEFFGRNAVTPLKVTYEDEPPPTPQGGDLSVDHALVKSRAWSYEREWRCVRQFDRTESRDVLFTPEVIAKVVIGANMSKHHTSQLFQHVNVMQHDGHHIAVFDSEPQHHTWRFIHNPSTKRLCPECTGIGYIDTSGFKPG